MNCGKMEVGQILTEIYARKTEFDFIILPAGLHKSAGFFVTPSFWHEPNDQMA